MNYKSTEFNEFGNIGITKYGDMRYDKKQWKIKISKKTNYIEGAGIFVDTYTCCFKNIEKNKNYTIDLGTTHLHSLLQISDDTFFLFTIDSGYIFRRISFRDNTIKYLHRFNTEGCLNNFFLSEDIFVYNTYSFETFMYSISKNEQIDTNINYLVSSNIKISDSEFAKSRKILPIYIDGSCYPTYLRIDYMLFSKLQKHYFQLLIDAKSLEPIILYDSLRKIYGNLKHNFKRCSCSISNLPAFFNSENELLSSIDRFFDTFIFQDNCKNTDELLEIIQDN